MDSSVLKRKLLKFAGAGSFHKMAPAQMEEFLGIVLEGCRLQEFAPFGALTDVLKKPRSAFEYYGVHYASHEVRREWTSHDSVEILPEAAPVTLKTRAAEIFRGRSSSGVLPGVTSLTEQESLLLTQEGEWLWINIFLNATLPKDSTTIREALVRITNIELLGRKLKGEWLARHRPLASKLLSSIDGILHQEIDKRRARLRDCRRAEGIFDLVNLIYDEKKK